MNPYQGSPMNVSKNSSFSNLRLGFSGLFDHINNKILITTPFRYFLIFDLVSGLLKRQNTEGYINYDGFLLNPENHTLFVAHNINPYYKSYVVEYDYILDSVASRTNNLTGIIQHLKYGGSKQQLFFCSSLNLGLYDFNYNDIETELNLNFTIIDSVATDTKNKRLYLTSHDATKQLTKNISFEGKSHIIILSHSYLMEMYQFKFEGDLNQTLETGNETTGIRNEDSISISNDEIKVNFILIALIAGGVILVFLFIRFLYKYIKSRKTNISIPKVEIENHMKFQSEKRFDTEKELKAEEEDEEK